MNIDYSGVNELERALAHTTTELLWLCSLDSKGTTSLGLGNCCDSNL